MSISACSRPSRSRRDRTGRSRAARTSRSPASTLTHRARFAISISGWASSRLSLQNDPEAHAQVSLLVVECALSLDDDEACSWLNVIEDRALLIHRNLRRLSEFGLDVLQEDPDGDRPFPVSDRNLQMLSGAPCPDIALLRGGRVRVDLEGTDEAPLPGDILRNRGGGAEAHLVG